MNRLVISVVFASAAACTPAVPDAPSYDTDVRPILMANCARCHGPPAEGEQEQRYCLRVDLWDALADATAPDNMGAIGACPVDQADSSSQVGNIIYGASLGGGEIVAQSLSGAMPKDGPRLTSRQLEILTRWRDAGFPRRSTGTNQPPTIEFVTPPASGVTVAVTDLSYDVQYVVADPDGDAVTWSLTWAGGGRAGTFATGLHEGSNTTTIDISVLSSGTYTLTAHLDDSMDLVDVVAPGTLTVPPGRNATPLVTVIAPNGGESYYNNQSADVVFLADDGESPTLTCDVIARSGAGTISVASGVAVTSGQMATRTWPLGGVAVRSDYTIEVSCTDDGAPATPPMPETGSDSSDAAFAVTAPPQLVSFSTQIMPIFTGGPSACTGTMCHDNSMPQEGLNLTTAANAYGGLVNVSSSSAMCGSYMRVLPNQPDQSYLVFKLQGSGACFAGSRMPKAPQTPLTSTQVQLVRDWIANGAPNN